MTVAIEIRGRETSCQKFKAIRIACNVNWSPLDEEMKILHLKNVKCIGHGHRARPRVAVSRYWIEVTDKSIFFICFRWNSNALPLNCVKNVQKIYLFHESFVPSGVWRNYLRIYCPAKYRPLHKRHEGCPRREHGRVIDLLHTFHSFISLDGLDALAANKL